ncbi:MAG: DUF898 family protein [Deltaproteobacteria bacterium]|nr:DUF898 family protein [Deltaproteobacteria bacterium]
MGKGNCEFKGSGGQYFATVFIHLFLVSFITMGIYSPWAWVKLLKLKASHTTINGKKIAFAGTGSQLFVLILVNGFLTLITFGFFGPWALCKLFNWLAKNTLADGAPSQFTGTGGSLFPLYLIHLVILPVLTLGIYSILGFYRLFAWKEEHTRYGGEMTTFGGSFGQFFKISLISWILNAVTLNLFAPWSICMFYRWQVHGLAVGDQNDIEHFPPVKVKAFVSIVFILIGLIILFGLFSFINTVLNQLDNHQPKALDTRKDAGLSRIGKVKVETPKGAVPAAKISSSIITPKIDPAPGSSQSKTVPKDPEKENQQLLQEIKKLDDVIKKEPRNADAFYNRGRLYAAKGEIPQAIKDYSQALEIDDKNVDSFYNRGLLYAEMERYEEAIKDFDSAIKLDPRAADAYCNRGNAHYLMGRTDAAIVDYSEALKIKPNDSDVYFNRGLVYLNKGDKANSDAAFKKATQLGSKKAEEYLK